MNSIWNVPKRDVIGVNLLNNSSDKKRKNFKHSVIKDVLRRAKGKCMRCHDPLRERGFDFDHKDKDPSNNKPENCWVICKTCHGGVTRLIKRKKIKDFMGNTIGYKNVMEKPRRKAPKKRRSSVRRVKKKKRRQTTTMFGVRVPKNYRMF